MVSEKKSAPRLSLPMHQWLDAARAADTPIAWRGEQTLSLAQLRADVALLSARLVERSEKRWALCFDDSYRFAVALLAALYGGKLPVIFGHQREAILKEQRADFDALLTDLPLSPGTAVLAVEEGHGVLPPLPAWPSDPQFILYTSGSTGAPQAVVKSVAAMDSESELLAPQWLPALRHCRIAASVSHQHMYGLSFRLFMPMAFGLPFDARLTEYHEQLIAKNTRYPLVFISSPAWLKRLDPALAVSECVQVFSAGGPLALAEAQLTQRALGVLPLEIYGTTETGALAWRQQTAPSTRWQLFAGVTLARKAHAIEADSPLVPAPVALSDILNLAADGRHFELLGRRDRIIKIEEKRLSLAEIEKRLLALPEIADAAILPLQQGGRTVLGVAIVLSALGMTQRQTLGDGRFTRGLRQALRPWLEPAALPRSWRIIRAIPLNAQGKRAYAELQELFL
ncbi:AMP-binding protein [Serratia odorifera]|jgi:acyl-coenzyme A synthetase/AMP-(fatty) acid ligase|uniref:AMP-binding protein n=1 Tax=Serratia odorifera TaxID=618 RepID=UPI00236203FA|nr:AMP-binding protein [Serratia odorifera]HEJ9095466.1 acyl-CoA synthetase [Serratia odorifera]